MSEAPAVPYTGVAVLEAMTAARNYNEALVALITSEQPNPGAKILDFGAGFGTYADMLRLRGYEPDCLEVDESLCGALAGKGYHVATEIGSLEPRSYDLIYALNVFEHIEDDMDTLRRLAELLAPGGRVLIYVPAFQVLYSAFDRLVGHHRRYTRSSMRSLAEAAGLAVKELRYCDPLGWPMALLFKFVGNKEGTISGRSVGAYDRAVFPMSRRLEPVFGQLFGKNVLMVGEYWPPV